MGVAELILGETRIRASAEKYHPRKKSNIQNILVS
jgi:hypothetical protein